MLTYFLAAFINRTKSQYDSIYVSRFIMIVAHATCKYYSAKFVALKINQNKGYDRENKQLRISQRVLKLSWHSMNT